MAESEITKRAIADSLKELTKTKPFDKISVKDISEKCGINRQTFYYHFIDKFDLLEWIYQTELFDKYMADVDFTIWYDRIILVLEAMKEEKSFYVNTVNHTENYIQRYMVEQAQVLFQKAIDKLDEHRKVDETQRRFIAKFFAYGACGMIFEWVSNGMEQEPQIVAAHMMKMLITCESAAYLYVTEDVIEGNEKKIDQV
ncbi:MAG: dihydroxyacetone kinase transcriptional activator DhaS [Eubacterium sp.]|nr:dihydroxyacetone kinase transcriptional activator DhaS [Eubacterium sp.]